MKKKVLVIIIMLSILSPILVNQNHTSMFDLRDEDNIDIENSTNFLQPKFALADEKVVDNVLPNSGFEEANADNHPINIDTDETGMTYQDESYDLDAHSGSYSAFVQGQGSITGQAYSPLYQQINDAPNSYLNQSFTLDFWYKILDTPDPSIPSRTQIQVSFYDSGVYKQIYYVLSYHTGLSNYTNNYYLDLNSTWNIWHHTNRNVTADYEALFGPIGADAHITYFYLYVISSSQATAPTMALFDDISLTSSSSGNVIENNGFEAGDGYWWKQINSMGDISLTTDHTEGSRALNITMANQFDDVASDYQSSNIYKYFGYPQGYFTTQPNEAMLSFDWKYLDAAGGGSGQRALFEVQLRDLSGYKYVRIMLGHGEDSIDQSNSSNNYYLYADGFGTRDLWHSYELDLYNAATYFGSTNITIRQVRCYAYMGYELNSSTTVILDNLQLRTFPFGDAGFEQEWYSGIQFTGWYASTSSTSYISRTSDSHSGENAANVSSYGGFGQTYIYKSNMYYTLKPGIFTDIWWKLDRISGTDSYASIVFRFNDGRYLHYYLGKDDSYTDNNGTYNAVYYIDNINSTGTWNNLHRDIYNDATAVFGSKIFNISTAYVYADEGSGGDVSLLIDDFHLIDGLNPVINSVSLTNTPKYYETASVEVDAEDTISGVKEVIIYYDIGSGWEYTSAAFDGMYYDGTIPVAPYGTAVDFYVEVKDKAGNTVVDDNGGSYYNYIIQDDINPLISFTAPINGSTVTGDVLLQVDTSDIGSDIERVEYYDGLTHLQTVMGSPNEYLWDTRSVSNGAHTILATAYDNAGNYRTTAEIMLLVTDNDLTPPLVSNAQLIPTVSVYDEAVQIIVTATDETSMKTVDISYKIGAGNWQLHDMSKVGLVYEYFIPAAVWNVEVLYYIVATDYFDQETSLGTQGSPLSYVVGDLILPTIEVDGPSTVTILNQEVTFTLSGSDVGSGVALVGLTVNGELAFSDTTSPQMFVINTKDYENGEYSFVFFVEDGAGNIAERVFDYTIENKPGQGAIPIFQNYGILWGIGLAGVLYGGTMLTLYILKKRGIIGGGK